MTYEGKVYQAKSGQWSWEVTRDGEPIVCGAGYETEDEAWSDMYGALSHYEDSGYRAGGIAAMSADDIKCPLSEQDIDDIVLLGGYHNAVGGIYANSVYDFARDVAIAAIQADRASRDERLRDEALLRQALEALERGAWDTLSGRNAAFAIRERLGLAQENPYEGR